MKENNVENEVKTKKTGKVILVLFFILIILGATFYVLYDKGIILKDKIKDSANNSSKKDDNKVNDDEEISLSEADMNKIKAYKTLKYASYLKDRPNGIKSFSNDEIATLVSYHGDNNEKNFTLIKDFDDESNAVYEIAGVEVDNYIKSVFGDVKYDKKDLVGANAIHSSELSYYDTYDLSVMEKNMPLFCGYEYLSYDNKNNKFTVSAEPGCGGFGEEAFTPFEPVKFVSAKRTGEDLVVTLKAVYVSYDYIDDSETIKAVIYSDPNETNKIATVVLEDDVEDPSIDDYIDEASTITQNYKYDKANNTYYFVSSSISND